MGDVNLLVGTLVRILQGKVVDNLNRFLRYLDPSNTTPNKHFMACVVIVCVAPKAEPMYNHALRALEVIADDETRYGPTWRELLCPDPHQGMYLLARWVLIWHGLKAWSKGNSREFDVANTMLSIAASEVNLHNLITTPDGDVRGLPGERGDIQDGIERHAMTAVFRELIGYEHRGYNGKPRPLENKLRPERALCNFYDLDGDSGLWYGPAWAVRKCVERYGQDVHNRIDSTEVPCRLTLELSIWRWDGGTLAAFTDPGTPELRRAHVTTGSMAARRSEDKVEDITTAVRIEHGAPGRHKVSTVLTWKTPVPSIPGNAKLIARIPAAK